jgi:uncharacterized phage protein (TIGR01671 family)
MNREIKFRAWDISHKCFLPNDVYAIISTDFNAFGVMLKDWDNYKEGEYFYKDSQVLMQYTGLKDKNGKKIYEGDILNIGFGGDASMVYHTHNYCVVFWCDKNLQWKTKYNKGDNPLTGYYLPVYEVIGNIYENPELLK